MKCERCGNLFKAIPDDIQSDNVLFVYCPSCGLTSDNYITDDVLELAQIIIKNRANIIIQDSLKDLEQSNSQWHGIFEFKVVNDPELENEYPIRSSVEAMEIVQFPCCNRTAKIKPLLKMTGCYCPFCGVKNYEFE